jgi:hypothetical protein
MNDKELTERTDAMLSAIRMRVRGLTANDRYALLSVLASRLSELNDDTVEPSDDPGEAD